MHFLGVGVPCRPLDDPVAELAVVLLDTRGAVHAVEWRRGLDEVAALTRVLANGETLLAAGAPLCDLREARSRRAVQALRRRLAATDVESGVLECDADSVPFETPELEDAPWPPQVCTHGCRSSARTVRLARTCDDLVRRMGLLVSARPPVDLYSNEVTAALLTEPTPATARGLEQRTTLLNALLCAWSASSWHTSPTRRTPATDVPLAG